MKTEQLRVYLLEAGDEFLMNGYEYRVKSIEQGVITYGIYVKSSFTWARTMTMGANSRRRIEFICNGKPVSKVVYERPVAIYDNKSAMGIADELRA